MKTALLLALILLPGSLFADPFQARDHEMILSLIEVQEEIDYLSSAVVGCQGAGRKHMDCMCENRAMFSHFSETVDGLFVKFPELDNCDLVTFRDYKGTQVTQSMAGIKQQAAVELNCASQN